MDKINNLMKEYVTNENQLISNLANVSAILYTNLENINWLGFYLANDNHDELFLGPFQGLQAVTNIKFTEGVCGECATKKETIVVEDVHCFEGHIACDLRSQSEIVVPILKKDGTLYGVLDVDSPIKHRFTNEDKLLFERIVKEIEKLI